MFKLPFIGSHTEARSGFQNAGELINLYPENSPEGTKGSGQGRVSLHATPGYTELRTLTDPSSGTGVRGLYIHDDKLIVICGGDFYALDPAITELTDITTVTTSQKKSIPPFGGEPEPDRTTTTTVTVPAEAFQQALPTGTTSGRVSIASSGGQGNQVAVADGVGIIVWYDNVKLGTPTGATLANPGVVTMADHGLSTGDKVTFTTDGDQAAMVETAVSITAATEADPGVLTTSAAHGIELDEEIWIENVLGMTELNKVSMTAGAVTSTTITLHTAEGSETNINTTGFGTFLTSVDSRVYQGWRESHNNEYVIAVEATEAADKFDLEAIDTTEWTAFGSAIVTVLRTQLFSPGFDTDTGFQNFTDFNTSSLGLKNSNDTTSSVSWTPETDTLSTDALSSDGVDVLAAIVGRITTNGVGSGTGASASATETNPQLWANPTNITTDNSNAATTNFTGGRGRD